MSALDDSRNTLLRPKGLPYRLPEIPYLRLRAELSACVHARLPPFKGSTLRGAFGHGLMAVAGEGGSQGSPSVYEQLFEGMVEGPLPPFSKGRLDPPRPYLLEPRCTAERFLPGDLLEFDLLLFGRAMAHQGVVVEALREMARVGLGERRYRFCLERVHVLTPLWNREVPYRADDRQRTGLGAASKVAPLEPLPDRVTLRFTSPTRLVRHKRTLYQPSLRNLVQHMVLRQLNLAHFHVGGAEVDWTFNPLLVHADKIRVEERKLRPVSQSRYSNRQGRGHSLHGFVGEMTVAGDLAPFTRLFRNAEIVHVGKSAVQGFGQLEVAA